MKEDDQGICRLEGNLVAAPQGDKYLGNMADSEEENEANSPRLVASDFDIFAEKLLKHHLLLTALELHTELVEVGLEIPRLRDFFSNPGNFERQYLSGSRDALSSVIREYFCIFTLWFVVIVLVDIYFVGM